MVLKSFVERKQAVLSWILIIMSHFWIALAIAFNEQFKFDQVHLYLSGIAVSGILGLVCLRWLKFHEDEINLDKFQGHSYQHPKIALIFLIACLGVSGFPISPTFVGEDLIFAHIRAHQAVLEAVICIGVCVGGLVIV